MLRTYGKSFLLSTLLILFAGAECSNGFILPPAGVDPEINTLELDAFNQVNQQRIQNGESLLQMDNSVRNVARAHSQDMVDRDFFAHDNPDGESPFDRLAAAEITYSIAGENIAFTNHSDPVPRIVQGWMDSQGHRENILRDSFTHTGMGVAINSGVDPEEFYFTQVFIGKRSGKDGEEIVFYYDTPIAVVSEEPNSEPFQK